MENKPDLDLLRDAAQGPLALRFEWEGNGTRRRLFFYARKVDAPRWQAADILRAGAAGLIDGDGDSWEITDLGRAVLAKVG